MTLSKTLFRIVIFLLLVPNPVGATTIYIPDDHSTIQDGISASVDGDTVIVRNGIYEESISFSGRNIVLASEYLTTGDTLHIRETIISGSGSDPVVRFENRESSLAKIMGFTIALGTWGVKCVDSSPVISNNLILDNYVYTDEYNYSAGGIYCEYSHALIINNVIIQNGAIFNGSDPGNADGFGVYSYSSDLVILNNIICKNYSESLFYHFLCGYYGEDSYAILINNTICDNATYLPDGYGGGVIGDGILVNNIIYDNYPTEVSGFFDARYNNVSTLLWGEGNISENPRFNRPYQYDYHLMSVSCGDSVDSPCIDAGDPAFIDSSLDCSWGSGTERSDMGAYGGGDSATVYADRYFPNLPNSITFIANYPNPFNASTKIVYSSPEQADVRIEIYNVLGEKVATLFDNYQSAGNHTISWDASAFSSGVYFARMETGDTSQNVKMVLLK